jgi:hypothetical protein
MPVRAPDSSISVRQQVPCDSDLDHAREIDDRSGSRKSNTYNVILLQPEMPAMSRTAQQTPTGEPCGGLQGEGGRGDRARTCAGDAG